MPGLAKRVFAVAATLAAGLALAGCTPSFPPRDSGAQSQQSGETAELLDWEEGRRFATFPVEEHVLPGVPFTLWAHPDAVGDHTELLLSENRQVESFDIASASSVQIQGTALALMPSGEFFGAGPTGAAGVFDSDGAFTALTQIVPEHNTFSLPESPSYKELKPVAASIGSRPGQGGSLVFWVSADREGEDWSLHVWDQSASSITELASSASMMGGFGSVEIEMGASPHLSASGQYAYFTLLVPGALIEVAWPGGRMHEFPPLTDTRPGKVEAVFQVALNEPGDVRWLGGRLAVQADPYFTQGVFSVSTEFEDEGRQSADELALEDTAQSGDAEEFRDLSGSATCAALTGATCQSPIRAVVWSDALGIEPVFGTGPAEDWLIEPMAAGERYLVASIGPAFDSGSAWLAIWDLQEVRMRALIQTEGLAQAASAGEVVAWTDSAGTFTWVRDTLSDSPGQILSLLGPGGLAPLLEPGSLAVGVQDEDGQDWWLKDPDVGPERTP